MILLYRSVKSGIHSAFFYKTQNNFFLAILFNFFNFCNFINWDSSFIPVIKKFTTFAFECDVFICDVYFVLHWGSAVKHVELFYKLNDVLFSSVNFFSFLVILEKFDYLKVMKVFHSIFIGVVCKLSRRTNNFITNLLFAT